MYNVHCTLYIIHYTFFSEYAKQDNLFTYLPDIFRIITDSFGFKALFEVTALEYSPGGILEKHFKSRCYLQKFVRNVKVYLINVALGLR